jgi:hypothetical protein
LKKYTFLTGTGDGHQVVVTEKETYVWYEFSNESDCWTFLKNQPKAEFKGVKVARGSFQLEDLSWEQRTTKTYRVIVRK